MADLEYDRHDLTALDILARACAAVAGEGAATIALRTLRRELTYLAFLQAGRSFDALGGASRASIANRAYGIAHEWKARPRQASARIFVESAVEKVVPWIERLHGAATRIPARKAAQVAAGALVAVLLFAIGGDAKVDPHALAVSESPAPVAEAMPVEVREAVAQIGVASWYGRWHHGKPTATGESFDMNALTAAHRSLPLDSKIRVTNLDNGKRIEVTVNDRGPYIDGRVLDLSMKAAEKLEMKHQGLARVKIERVE
jgi:anti-sigma regulatory factor (Ser/Thr protein kinase)